MFWQLNKCYEFGPFRLETRERRLLRDNKVVPLTPKVFEILVLLVQNQGHLLTKDEVMRLVWPNTAVEEGNLARNISTLRTALGERPRECQYIETVPGRGYRFVANVTEVNEESLRSPIHSIAVLPFVNVGADPDLEYLSDGITESLINNLAQLAQLRVMSRNSVFRYKGQQTAIPVVGRDLKVEAVLLGRVARHEQSLSIGVELVDAREESHIWGAQYTRKLEDILLIQETLANEIARTLRVRLTGKQLPRQTGNPEAYHSYLKGRFYFNKLTPDGVQRGIEYFKQAVDQDPDFALAYVGMGDCYNYWARPNEASEAMSKALALDDKLGEAHASLGFFKFIYDWDFAGAEKEFQRALNLNPNYAEAHHWSSIYFANMGRNAESAIEAKLAVEIDPLSLLMNMGPPLVSYLGRDYQRASEQLLKVIELEPNFPAAHSVLGNTYVQLGLYDEAMFEYQEVLKLIKGVPSVSASVKALIAHAHARSGHQIEALKLVDELTNPPHQTVVSPHSVAEIFAALDQKDVAFEWLEKAFDQHDMQMVSLKVNPTLDSLRDDPRFTTLMRRVGL